MEGDQKMNVEKYILEERIRSIAQELNIANKCVRRDSREIEAKNKEFRLIKWLSRRGSILYKRKGDKFQLMAKKTVSIFKQNGLSVHKKRAGFNSETQLVCFKC